MQKAARFLSPSRRYAELEESSLVAPPPRPTSVLLREHLNIAPQHLKYPSSLDFSHENFKLRSLALLLQVKEGALQEILLSDNALESLTELNRFTALKVLVASRNALVSGPGMRLSCPKLTRLDLSGNQLAAVPPLQDVPLLQVLNLSRNEISTGWGELQACLGLQALDVAHNQLYWDENQGELSRAVAVLRALKRLRVLSLRGNPTCAQPGYRGWVLANAPRLEVFDEQPVSAEERRGVAPAEHSRTEAARSLLSDDGAAEAEAAAAAEAASAAHGRELSRRRSGGAEAAPVQVRIFGGALEDLLEAEQAELPAVVRLVTRHVQERCPPDGADLLQDGAPSLVMSLRNAFELGAKEGTAALARGRDERYRDVRAACSLLRSFLLELAQPLVPVDFFLPLLRAAQACERCAPAEAAHRRREMEDVLRPMPPQATLLLEHVLIFLLTAAAPFWHDDLYRRQLARAWAPCVLRAPARVKGQFEGRVGDTVRAVRPSRGPLPWQGRQL